MTPTSSGRLDQLTPGLSARERAVLSVRATLLDEREDRRVRSTMPLSQSVEFNHFIGLANGVLHVLLPQALVLQQEVEALSLRYTLLLAISAWGAQQTSLRSALALVGAMPIARSEYERLVEEGRGQYVPLAAAGELLESTEEADKLKPESEYRRAMRALAESGTIRSRGSGRTLSVELGSLYDHLGIAYEPRTEAGWRYEVLPDDEYAGQRWRGEMAERACSLHGPGFPPFPPLLQEADAHGGSVVDALRTALHARVRDELAVRWSSLLAIETVADEAVQAFQDEVVIPEAMRSLLAGARLELQRLHEQGEDLLELGPLPLVDQAFVELLRKGLGRNERLYL